MINTTSILALLIGVILVLSFNVKKDQFTEDYIEFYDSLQEFREVVEIHGDTATAKVLLEEESKKIIQWESRMNEESAGKWDSFESAWPLPPRNWRCQLECTYQFWRCKTQLGGDLFMCLAAYNDCKQGCN